MQKGASFDKASEHLLGAADGIRLARAESDLALPLPVLTAFCSPGIFWQLPPMQLSPMPQLCPQLPQLLLSLIKLAEDTQLPMHDV